MRYVAYFRVSTARQGRSGLGLDAQRAAVRDHLDAKGATPRAEFVEIESGRRRDRPELTRALEACRLYRAVLVIAKLDRLARDASFLLSLRDAGVEFVCCDMPEANRLTVAILAVIAEHEAEMISARTRAALAAARARGVELGGFRGFRPSAADQARATQAKQRLAGERASRVAPVVAGLRANGITSLRAIARELTALGVPTAGGGAVWHPTMVLRLAAHETIDADRGSVPGGTG